MQVTGVLADALNWASKEGETFGVTLRANTKANEEWNKAVNAAESAEDYFNLALQNCGSEAERNQLILNTLTSSYSAAADAFYKNNEQLVQSRQNEAALAAVTAKVGSASAVAKNGLMQLFGVQQDGSIRAGSALAWLNDKADSLVELFQQWSQDGTMDSLAQKFDQGLARGAELASQAFQWLTENGDTIRRWIVGLGSALAMVKIVQFVSGVISAVKTVALFAKTVGVIVAANPIVLGIAAAIAAGALLIANWDTVKAKASELWERAKETFGGIKDSIVGAFEEAKDKAAGFFSWLDEKVEGIPVIGSIYQGAKSVGGWVADKISGHATGTSFFSGGWTRVNERGGEILRLPGGTQIIPHDISRQMVGGSSIAVYVTVQGNVIGNQAYAQELGDIIGQRILRALRNT